MMIRGSPRVRNLFSQIEPIASNGAINTTNGHTSAGTFKNDIDIGADTGHSTNAV
ncbi:MAG: hypothetical protein AAB669_02300 [Patescibacteria group bacterium]